MSKIRAHVNKELREIVKSSKSYKTQLFERITDLSLNLRDYRRSKKK